MTYNKLRLTDREVEICNLITDGFQRNDISSKLGITVRTVDVHRTNINKKLRTRNVVDIVKYTLNFLQKDSDDR